MTEKDKLLITSNGDHPEPCIDYDVKTGRCKSSGNKCDACYENSLKNWKDIS